MLMLCHPTQNSKLKTAVRVLILTAWYHPFIHPRAHRWTCIAEHWAAQGHDVHVVCARRRDCPDESVLNGVQVHRAGFDSLKELVYYLLGSTGGRGRVGAAVRKPGPVERAAMWLYRTVWKNLHFPDDACLWYFPARRKVQDLLQKQPFDAVISVSLPFTGHLVGRYAKRLFPGLRWLADIGDPFTITATPPNNALLFGRLSRRLERQVLEQTDAVVVTNAGAVRAYRERFGAVAGKLAVAPPVWQPLPQPPDNSTGQALPRGGGGYIPRSGFFGKQAIPASLPETFPVLEGKPPSPPGESLSRTVVGRLGVGFFGALYAPVRTPDAFLDLLEKIHTAYPDLFERLRVHFFGEVFPEFFEKLNCVGIQLHGLRPRAEVQDAMRQMDFLLHIGNTTEYQLPSKVVDYLAAGKPVVHLSYVAADPFLDFWGNTPGLLTLRVQNGRVADADILHLAAFLNSNHTEPAESERFARVQNFTVQAVAEVYERLLFPPAG